MLLRRTAGATGTTANDTLSRVYSERGAGRRWAMWVRCTWRCVAANVQSFPQIIMQIN